MFLAYTASMKGRQQVCRCGQYDIMSDHLDAAPLHTTHDKLNPLANHLQDHLTGMRGYADLPVQITIPITIIVACACPHPRIFHCVH